MEHFFNDNELKQALQIIMIKHKVNIDNFTQQDYQSIIKAMDGFTKKELIKAFNYIDCLSMRAYKKRFNQLITGNAFKNLLLELEARKQFELVVMILRYIENSKNGAFLFDNLFINYIIASTGTAKAIKLWSAGKLKSKFIKLYIEAKQQNKISIEILKHGDFSDIYDIEIIKLKNQDTVKPSVKSIKNTSTNKLINREYCYLANLSKQSKYNILDYCINLSQKQINFITKKHFAKKLN